jgi:hypothetical protein
MSFVLLPTCSLVSTPSVYEVSDELVSLKFEGSSAKVCQNVISQFNKSGSIEEISLRTGYSDKLVRSVIDELKFDGLVLDTSFPENMDSSSAIAFVNEASVFWNRTLMAQPAPKRLFAGEQTESMVIGWGIEFCHFIRAARSYMARGASRTNESTKFYEELWDHFVEEAFHDKIFERGLAKCDSHFADISKRVPLATTNALTNYLFDVAEEGPLQYASLFAVMQPTRIKPSIQDVQSKYNVLREYYPFAAPMFDAFEEHDLIDAKLGHSEIALHSMINSMGAMSRKEMEQIIKTIQNTAEHFMVFFEGIAEHYRSVIQTKFRESPRLASLIHHAESELAN